MRADEAISLMRELLSSPAISFEEYWTLAEMMLRWGRVHDGAQFIASALQDEALQKRFRQATWLNLPYCSLNPDALMASGACPIF